MTDQEKIAEMIGGKDRMIGELYSRCRALEEAYQKITKERDDLTAELDNMKTDKKDTP